MLKLFRLIRKQLLLENKTSRYLAYAFGEILLVVLGILIALQINNRNENRNQDKEEYKVLVRMVDELDQNIERMIFLDTASSSTVAVSVKEAVTFFDSMKMLIEDGLDRSELDFICSGPLTRFFRLNLSNDAFEEMKNRGLFYNLESPSLAESIQLYYKLIEREEKYNDDIHNSMGKEKESVRYGFSKFREDYKRLGINALKSHPWILDPNSEGFYDLRLYVNQQDWGLNRCRDKMYNIVDESQKLKKAILDYLK